MDSFNDIYAMLEWVPGLTSSIDMEKGMAFVHLATQLKGTILLKQKATHGFSDSMVFKGYFVSCPLLQQVAYTDTHMWQQHKHCSLQPMCVNTDCVKHGFLLRR